MDDPIAEPNEPVPNELRILASTENLGELRSVHRLATLLGRTVKKRTRIHLYRQGLVLSGGQGGFVLFRWDQSTVTRRGSAVVLRRADGAVFPFLPGRWTDADALTRAIDENMAGRGGA